MKMIKLILVFVLTIFITGCGESDRVVLEPDYQGEGTLNCTREGELEGGSVNFRYEVDYRDGYITKLHSIEKVNSSDKELLDTYEDAYRNIFAVYKDLNYYDNKVTRNDQSVVSDTIINYEKIDMEKLLEIEGEEDNVIEDGKVKVDTWLGFAKKFGTTCESN